MTFIKYLRTVVIHMLKPGPADSRFPGIGDRVQGVATWMHVELYLWFLNNVYRFKRIVCHHGQFPQLAALIYTDCSTVEAAIWSGWLQQEEANIIAEWTAFAKAECAGARNRKYIFMHRQ